jgi:hypothetical protein
VSIKKAAKLAAFFKEEERRGVKCTRLTALYPDIGGNRKNFIFFIAASVACLRTGNACVMNRAR